MNELPGKLEHSLRIVGEDRGDPTPWNSGAGLNIEANKPNTELTFSAVCIAPDGTNIQMVAAASNGGVYHNVRKQEDGSYTGWNRIDQKMFAGELDKKVLWTDITVADEEKISVLAILQDGKFYQTSRKLSDGSWGKWGPIAQANPDRATEVEKKFNEVKVVEKMRGALADLFQRHMALGNEGESSVEEFKLDGTKVKFKIKMRHRHIWKKNGIKATAFDVSNTVEGALDLANLGEAKRVKNYHRSKQNCAGRIWDKRGINNRRTDSCCSYSIIRCDNSPAGDRGSNRPWNRDRQRAGANELTTGTRVGSSHPAGGRG